MPEDTISQAISEAIQPLIDRNNALEESLGDAVASLAFEDRGWLRLFGLSGEHLEGLDLNEVKEISEKMRMKTGLAGLYKRGVDLDTGYVWARGINIPGTEQQKGSGAPGALRAFYRNNRETLFSASAQGELQKTRYTDGNIFVLCEPGKRARVIPLKEIDGIKVNPDFPSEVWAYLRVWTPDTQKPTEIQKRWYYTKRFDGRKQKSFSDQAGGVIPVGSGVIVDQKFNSQTGWVLGVPDVAAAAPWIEAYNEIMQYGRVVNESLSKILFKIISASKKGAQNAAARVAGTTVHGGTAAMPEGTDVQAINSAGKGYDFTSARPVGAEAAAALNVPLAEFLADTSAAGASYGALSALQPSVLNAKLFQQKQAIELYTEIFEAYGIPVPEMSFDPIVEPDFYRQAQGLTLLSRVLSDQEYRAEGLDLLNIDGDSSKIPPLLAMRNVTPASADQTTSSAASPDQGNQSASAGGADSGSLNDQRTDLVSEAFMAAQVDQMRELVERFQSIAERLDAQ